jgi:periplasmic protein TonB
MFEDVEQMGKSDGAKRLLSLAVSMVVHFVLIIVVIIVPLWYFNALPEGEILTFLIAPPPPPPAPPPPAPPPTNVKAVPKTAVVDPNQFLAPTEIPKDIPPPSDEAPVIGVQNIVGGIPGGVSGGVTGGVPGGVVGNLLNNVSTVAPPPPPKPVKRDPIRVGGNVQESKLIRRVEPAYPELAKRARVQGKVVLVVTVDEEGNVSNITINDGHPLLNDAAKAAVAQWKYSPTLLNGEPVPVIATVTVIFNLK